MDREGKYLIYDPMTAEVEVQEFLYGYIRLVKPKLVVETGCYHGHTARKMAEALAENGEGVLHTCDTDIACVGRAFLRTAGLPVKVHYQPSVEMIRSLPDKSVDIAFLDCGDRVQAARALLPKLSPFAAVLLHDTLIHHQQEVVEIQSLTNWTAIQLMPQGRGLTLFIVRLLPPPHL